MERLLAITPWVASQPDGVSIDEICARFDIAHDQLVDDLETLFLVGLHPFTPDALVDVTVEDDRVWIRYAEMFAAPQLTPVQALALLSSAQVLVGDDTDSDTPLARGLAKLAAAIGVTLGAEVDVRLDGVDSGVLSRLTGAVADRRTVELDYFAYTRNERSTRLVDPLAVGEHDGAWYLRAWCHKAGADRTFRLDRIDRLELTEAEFEARDDVDPFGGFVPSDELPLAVIEIDAADRWLIERHPVESISEANGRLTVGLRVTTATVLARLLMRAGPDGRLVSCSDASIGGPGVAELATRSLAKYR